MPFNIQSFLFLACVGRRGLDKELMKSMGRRILNCLRR